jgi:branched-chain amino acid transport system permease protein
MATTFSGAKFWSVRLLSIAVTFAALYALQVIVVPHLGIYDVRLLVLSLLFGALAVSLNLINGITGQFSMGHAAFYLIGAYTSGKLTQVFFERQPLAGAMWLLCMVVVAGVAAALAGFIVGLPSLRLRGDYLAIVTLGFGEIARVIVINQDGSKTSFGGLDLGGAYAMSLQHNKITEIAHVALLFIVTIAVARNLLKTGHGLAFLSVREDEIAAEATGVNTTRFKVTSFMLGAALAGMAGALFAHYNGTIAPDDFKMDVSFMIVTMVVIGGTGSITGAAVAGVGLKLLEEALRKLESIPAIGLIGMLLAIIIVVALYKVLAARKSMSATLESDPIAFALIGMGLVGCIAAVYGDVLLWKSGFSIIIKIAGTIMIAALILGLAATRHRRIATARFGTLTTGIAAVIALKIPFTLALERVPLLYDNLKNTQYTPSDLRWALFAISLIIVMLVRPQGLFGHHEFSWDFVKKLLGKPHQETEVAA